MDDSFTIKLNLTERGKAFFKLIEIEDNLKGALAIDLMPYETKAHIKRALKSVYAATSAFNEETLRIAKRVNP